MALKSDMAFNFGHFSIENGEVSLDNKAPKAVSHHLSTAANNAQCKLKGWIVKTEKR